MSPLGQKRTYAVQKAMSALHPIATAKADLRKTPCLRGSFPMGRIVILRWESMEALNRWRDSAEYEAIRKVGEGFAISSRPRRLFVRRSAVCSHTTRSSARRFERDLAISLRGLAPNVAFGAFRSLWASCADIGSFLVAYRSCIEVRCAPLTQGHEST